MAAGGGHLSFLSLPPELRNIIYDHLLIQTVRYRQPQRRTGEIDIPNKRSPLILRCETNIFAVCRKVYEEASSIFYGQNTVVVDVGGWLTGRNQTFRKDRGPGGPRSLRSGRSINTTPFSGLIYPHIFRRFENIRLDFGDPYNDPGWSPDLPDIVETARNLGVSLEHLSQFLVEDPPTMSPVTGSKKCLVLKVTRIWLRVGPTSHRPISEWHQRLMAIFAKDSVARVLRRLNMTRSVTISGAELTEGVVQQIHHSLFA